jgi:small conductance mechanosensitive channel
MLNTPDKKINPEWSSLRTHLLIILLKLRRVDWKFGIAYGDDVENFKRRLMIAEDSRILKDPANFIGLSELADSSVNFTVRVWVNAVDYWAVFFDMNEKVYTRFGDYNLNIPFPQMDVHVQDNKEQ